MLKDPASMKSEVEHKSYSCSLPVRYSISTETELSVSFILIGLIILTITYKCLDLFCTWTSSLANTIKQDYRIM